MTLSPEDQLIARTIILSEDVALETRCALALRLWEAGSLDSLDKQMVEFIQAHYEMIISAPKKEEDTNA